MNTDYDAILCDLGNVLVDFDHRIAVKKILSQTDKLEKEIYNMFFDSGLTKLFEEGKISPEDFFNKINAFLGLKMSCREFFYIWSDIFFQTERNTLMHQLLRDTKGTYKLVMISNINKEHFDFLFERYGIFKIFDSLILSYEVGYRKPAREIYDAALKAADTIPSKALYIDDRKDLVEKASVFGIKGIVYNGKESFLEIKKEIRG